MFKRTLPFLSIVLYLYVAAVHAIEISANTANSLVQVLVYKNENVVQFNTGTVISKETVITTADILTHGKRYVVYSLGTGAELGAEVTWKDKDKNIAILAVSGLTEPPIVFSKEKPAIGRLIMSMGVSRDGTGKPVASALEGVLRNEMTSSFNQQVYYVHNSPINRSYYGGPIINNCGEVVAINMMEPVKRMALFGKLSIDDPRNNVFSITQASLSKINQIQPLITFAPEICLTSKAMAQQKAEELEKKKKEMSELGKQNQKELEEFEKQKQEEIDKAMQQTKEELDRAKQQSQEELVKIQNEKDEALKAEELKRKKAEEKKRKQMYLIIAVALSVIFLLVILGALLNAKKKRAQMEAEAAARLAGEQARHESEKAAELERDAKEVSKRKADLDRLPNFVLEGKDPEGNNIALKLKGADIGATNDGIVLGRSPNRSEYILNHGTVSREHFRLMFVRDQLMIEDLGSQNGTMLNGELLDPNTPEAIMPSWEIKVGDVELVIRKL